MLGLERLGRGAERAMRRKITHYGGVHCAGCGAVLSVDDCCPGQPHGSSPQVASSWAADTWPEHDCFRKVDR